MIINDKNNNKLYKIITKDYTIVHTFGYNDINLNWI